jgi:hypothetical protein
MLELSRKEPGLFNIEASLETAGPVKESAFLFRVGLMFGDLEPSVLEALVKPVKAPIDCFDWPAFLNWSCILPSRAGLLEGNNCFPRSFFGFGASYSLTAWDSIASVIKEYAHARAQGLNSERGRDGVSGAFQQPVRTSFVAEEQIGRATGLVVIQPRAAWGILNSSNRAEVLEGVFGSLFVPRNCGSHTSRFLASGVWGIAI